MANRIHLKTLLAMSMSLLMMASATAAGRAIYVDDDGPAEFDNIQAAIDDANDGDIIIVNPGTYTSIGNRDIDFLGKAITVHSENKPDNCIIDCQGSEAQPHSGFYFHNSEDSNSVLDGFTIRNGYQVSGGGIVCSSSSPTIRNCIITNNRAEDDGGGIMCHAASPTIRNCIITNNIAEVWEGGGIRCRACRGATIDNCIITENSARFGGGIGSSGDNSTTFGDIIVTNCTFSANSAQYGGAVYVRDGSKPSMVNCILWGDSAPYGPEIALLSMWPDASLYVSFSDVQGGENDVYRHGYLYWEIGNIEADPCFVQPGYWDANGVWVDGDYHLLPDSPCIDAGDPNYLAEPNETDLDGKPRVIGGRVDMGAYESPIFAEARILPRTINLTSMGNWITSSIWLPEDYDVADIDPNSIFLEDEIQAVSVSVDEQRQFAIARFSRSRVQCILDVGLVDLTITGQLTDGAVFVGKDVMRVLNKGGRKLAK